MDAVSQAIQAARLRVDHAKAEFNAALADLERLEAMPAPSGLGGQPQEMRRATPSMTLQPRALGT